MRSAARRDETAAYALTVGITGIPDPGAEPVQASKRSDLWSLVVLDEACEIPDAVLFGG